MIKAETPSAVIPHKPVQPQDKKRKELEKRELKTVEEKPPRERKNEKEVLTHAKRDTRKESANSSSPVTNTVQAAKTPSEGAEEKKPSTRRDKIRDRRDSREHERYKERRHQGYHSRDLMANPQ